MQDFDRLRQDFDCIASVLRRCAEREEARPGVRQSSLGEIIAEIPVAEFRNRLMQSLTWGSFMGAAADDHFSEEKIF
jgi:hypothetical protein